MSNRPRIETPHELRALKNVGPATLSDLLKIFSNYLKQNQDVSKISVCLIYFVP